MGRRQALRFSPKQLRVLTWWSVPRVRAQYDAIICDGAVRSGKTLSMGLSFVLWALCQQPGGQVALCGKTILSLRRNLLTPLLGQLQRLGVGWRERVAQNYVDFFYRGRQVRCHLFGGQDASSAAYIQGMTLAGVLFDEVALMPRSFVEQALARCSVEGATFWFNCNPEHPQHWFYRRWILQAGARRALYLHFTMADNPGLSPGMRARYERLYEGEFYRRYILGEWVAPSGLVYDLFSPARHLRVVEQSACSRFAVSCDYGTVNPCSMGLWGYCDGRWHRLREYYHDARATGVRRTDEEHYAALEALVGDAAVEAVIVDPSAASFIACIRSHGRFAVRPADNRVAEGIAAVREALRQGRLSFDPGCGDCIREFSLYRWDERSQAECPVKEHDHAMDDLRYFVLWERGQGSGDGFHAAAVRRRM